MRTLLILFALLLTTAITTDATAADNQESSWDNFWGLDPEIESTMFTFNKQFRTQTAIHTIIAATDNCEQATTFFYAPEGTLFEIIPKGEATDYWIVRFYLRAGDGQTQSKGLYANTQAPSHSNLTVVNASKRYKLCLKSIPNYSYRRTGGLDTGILVVPFKLRQGDIFNDSTIGPYLAFRDESISYIAALGLSQISLVDNSNSEIKTATGITLAMGIIWEVNPEFDVAFIAGADHLSGSEGDSWQHQDEVWLSFAIGYNFSN
ncbi:MAG: hypothetical protein HWE13_02595 [Gammaproteobacteria bacterium]|nr:hypothetical protein [Gammaproteobacteria bacterium]NVK86983.1 hypothetical protein [Gammaproteobacteria bacterium]